MEEISAASALTRSRGVRSGNISSAAGDANYTLTMSRLFETIRRESDAGKKRTAFLAPLFVMDGTLADPVLLAKQIKVKLVRLGYEVDRFGDTLHISWDREEVAPPRVAPPLRPAVRLSRPPPNPPRGYAKPAGGVSVRRVHQGGK